MICVISGTNRQDNNTLHIARHYVNQLGRMGKQVQLLSLCDVDVTAKGKAFDHLEQIYLSPAKAFVMVLPEYNGSYPGILKLMIDNSNIKACWQYKKVLLTGVSTGRAGNLRGLEHLTGCLMHMQMLVHPNRLPISSVHAMLQEGLIQNDGLQAAIEQQLTEFNDYLK